MIDLLFKILLGAWCLAVTTLRAAWVLVLLLLLLGLSGVL